MTPGDRVVAYSHVQSNYEHSTSDELAFVISGDDNCVQLVIFPPGGPVRFERRCRFDPEKDFQAGGGYFRGVDEDAPDFSMLDHSSEPQWNELLRRQRERLGRAPSADREQVMKDQKQEREELRKELDRLHQRGVATDSPNDDRQRDVGGVDRAPGHQPPGPGSRPLIGQPTGTYDPYASTGGPPTTDEPRRI